MSQSRCWVNVNPHHSHVLCWFFFDNWAIYQNLWNWELVLLLFQIYMPAPELSLWNKSATSVYSNFWLCPTFTSLGLLLFERHMTDIFFSPDVLPEHYAPSCLNSSVSCELGFVPQCLPQLIGWFDWEVSLKSCWDDSLGLSMECLLNSYITSALHFQSRKKKEKVKRSGLTFPQVPSLTLTLRELFGWDRIPLSSWWKSR